MLCQVQLQMETIVFGTLTQIKINVTKLNQKIYHAVHTITINHYVINTTQVLSKDQQTHVSTIQLIHSVSLLNQNSNALV